MNPAELAERIQLVANVLPANSGMPRSDEVELAGWILRAAFPELFDGTGWLAPWNATAWMEDAGVWERVVENDDGTVSVKNSPDDIEAIYAAMRDVYLAKGVR